MYVVEGTPGQPGRATAREFFDFKVRCANSTAFSPDGRTAFFADSPSREIWAFDYDPETGRVQPASRRVFAAVPEPGVRAYGC